MRFMILLYFGGMINKAEIECENQALSKEIFWFEISHVIDQSHITKEKLLLYQDCWLNQAFLLVKSPYWSFPSFAD